jgi:outer membrane protein
MKKLLIAAAIAGSMLTVSALAGSKIGTVNMQTVMTQASQIHNASAAMKKKYAPLQAKLKAQVAVLQANMAKLKKNGATMSKSDLAKLQKTVQAGQQAVQQGQMGLQQHAMADQQAAMKSFAQTLKAATATVASKKGMTLVMPSNAVIYSAANMDITSDVLKQLNK